MSKGQKTFFAAMILAGLMTPAIVMWRDIVLAKCDAALRYHLANSPGAAADARGANYVIGVTQRQLTRCRPGLWNPVAVHAATNGSGNIQITFASPEGRARGKAITAPANGAVQWSKNAGAKHWTKAMPLPNTPATSAPMPQTGQQAPSGGKYPGGNPLKAHEIERLVVLYTNAERARHSLTTFTDDPAVAAIARGHSVNMARTGTFDHVVNGQDASDRAASAGYDCRAYRSDSSYTYGLSENIAEHPRVTWWLGNKPGHYDADESAMAYGLTQGWMNSPGHRANILEPEARRIGVGVFIVPEKQGRYIQERVYATQNFSECR